MVILVRSLIFPLAGECGIFCKNWQDISLYWWHKSLVETIFGVLCPDHVGFLCLGRPTKPRLLGHHSAVEAKRHPSVTYDFCLLLGIRSVGIKTTTQFFEVLLPCSWTSEFRFAARTFLDFSDSLSLSMLNGYLFSLYTALKPGNCCWLLLFSIFLACVPKKFQQKVVTLGRR